MKRPTPTSKQPTTKFTSPVRPLDAHSLRGVRGGGDFWRDGGITASDDWETRI